MTPDRLKAFISDARSASISVLDTVAHTNIATIPVDREPGEMAVTPDTETNSVITTLLISGDSAKDILITPDGRFAYIANASFPEVDLIDTTTGGRSRRICISEDSKN